VSTSQTFCTPKAGSLPKKVVVHCPDPLTDLWTHAVPAPKRTVCVPLVANEPPSLAMRVQVALGDGAAAAVAVRP
jgi:hypothetical protein